MSKQLSSEAKQTFQIVALLATVLVVGIHYKSAVPSQPELASATWNELLQEFLLGGVARVAVPLFAFAAGLFYFLSDDGTFATYRKKLRQRCRTVLLPYLVTATLAMTFWALVRLIEGKSLDLGPAEFLRTWLLRPPAEQLWFLRDLMVLVLVAPVLGWLCKHGASRVLLVGLVALAWFLDWQFTPILMGWYALHCETLLFFVLGCCAATRSAWIEKAVRISTPWLAGSCLVWMMLVGLRISVRPDFDIWYSTQHGSLDLLLHQCSILVGSVSLIGIAARLRFQSLLQLSGASFFVYLIHEFPLRAVVDRVAEQCLQPATSCWIVTPLVVGGCYAAAVVTSGLFPHAFALLTGGRAPAIQLFRRSWQSDMQLRDVRKRTP